MTFSTRRTSQDPLVKALVQSHKFNLLSVPRAGSDVFDLYLGKGRDILAPSQLDSLWQTKIALPVPRRGEKFEAPEKTYSAKLEINIVTKLTSKLFAAHGATLLDGKMDASLKSTGASAAEIRFFDVTRDSVGPIAVHKAIATKELDELSLDLLKGRDLYLVIGVVRAKGIEIRLTNAKQTDARVNIDLNQVAQGGASIVAENKESGSLVFKGESRIAFGVELVELRLNGETKTLMVGDLPPAIDIRAGVTVSSAFIGSPDGPIFVDLP
ncbi:MAG: hypothetical protein Q8K93_10210 [Reyranella sp.]|uniref:hypothetical protein n=1 Tax=Reyranella sp. TaxID=1929291 RepID=UPI00272F78F0|nr:hypothetical protein [Reyranella sp.]MDP1962561.1 hypothetical protein [Reyranella sp.]MDP2377542.1 hypothetical protein [Reyranella sp.]